MTLDGELLEILGMLVVGGRYCVTRDRMESCGALNSEMRSEGEL